MIDKFGKKITDCLIYFQSPVIIEGESEDKNTIWCHFCKVNFIKHVTDKLKTILYGGIFEHLSSEKHCKATDIFWITHNVEQKQKSIFIISKTDMLLYKKRLLPLVELYEKQEIDRTLCIANSIQVQEKRNLAISSGFESTSSRDIVNKTEKNKFGILQNPLGTHNGVRVWRGGIIKHKTDSDQIIHSKYTQKSNYEIKLNPFVRNIHTGAVPPWLCHDDCDQTSQTLGPSAAEFENHQVKKRKLNPNRVGAKFDHRTDNIQKDWLPSFGRVWTHGPRWKSRNEYKDKS